MHRNISHCLSSFLVQLSRLITMRVAHSSKSKGLNPDIMIQIMTLPVVISSGARFKGIKRLRRGGLLTVVWSVSPFPLLIPPFPHEVTTAVKQDLFRRYCSAGPVVLLTAGLGGRVVAEAQGYPQGRTG